MSSSSPVAPQAAPAEAVPDLTKDAMLQPECPFPPRNPSVLLSDGAFGLIRTSILRLAKPGCKMTGLPLQPMPQRTRASDMCWKEFEKLWTKEAENYADLETAHRLLNSGKQVGDLGKWFTSCKQRWMEHRAVNETNSAESQAYRTFEELLEVETKLVRFITENFDVLPKQEDIPRLIHHATKRDLRGLVDLWNHRVNWTHKFNTICNEEFAQYLEIKDLLAKEETAREAAKMEQWRREQEVQNAAKLKAYWELSDKLRAQEDIIDGGERKHQEEMREVLKKQQQARNKKEEDEAQERLVLLLLQGDSAEDVRPREFAACNVEVTTGTGAGVTNNVSTALAAVDGIADGAHPLDIGDREQEQALLQSEHRAAEKKILEQLEQGQEERRILHQAQQNRAAQQQNHQSQATQQQNLRSQAVQLQDVQA
ncbi:hypothetical protein QBC41DRAFT_298638 [Cercophora samala]|uniref:Uncharacterized protein n=1 Tax=Cercophora samala TaxID=330535 RepID=A0AA39ZLR0_9PEZI|nr:hypothetical protein QBC41DRAFT_298638 [Cercophora samala]